MIIRHTRRPLAAPRRGVRGYILAKTALLIVPLLLMAGLSVDVGYWYSRASDIQKAADAAALAGVVWLPETTLARQYALEAAARNGFVNGSDGVAVTVTPVAGQNRRLKVTITKDDVGGFLVDTLLGRFLPAYTKRPKRRIVQSPKFYFADVGVVNHLAKRGALRPGSELFGKAFENWVLHELNAHSRYSGLHHDLSYWRIAGGTEVDFVVNDLQVAIEAKSTARVIRCCRAPGRS